MLASAVIELKTRTGLRDLARCYLTIVGLFYAIAGLFGIQANGFLIAAILWQILISPYPLITSLEVMRNNYPAALRFATITDIPGSEHAMSSAIVLIGGVFAIIAGLALFRGRKWAAWLWSALLLASFVLACGYILAFIQMPQFRIGNAIRPFVLEVSWIVALLLAQIRTDVRRE